MTGSWSSQLLCCATPPRSNEQLISRSIGLLVPGTTERLDARGFLSAVFVKTNLDGPFIVVDHIEDPVEYPDGAVYFIELLIAEGGLVLFFCVVSEAVYEVDSEIDPALRSLVKDVLIALFFYIASIPRHSDVFLPRFREILQPFMDEGDEGRTKIISLAITMTRMPMKMTRKRKTVKMEPHRKKVCRSLHGIAETETTGLFSANCNKNCQHACFRSEFYHDVAFVVDANSR